MNCNLKIPVTKLNTALRKSIGTRDTLMMEYISTIVDENGFKPEFVEAVKEKLGFDVNDIPRGKTNEVVDFIKEYTNAIRPRVGYSYLKKNDTKGIGQFDYTSIDAREESKRHAANYALKAYKLIVFQLNKPINKYIEEQSKAQKRTITKRQLFADLITAQYKAEIRKRLVERGLITDAEARQLLAKNDIAQVEKLFGKDVTVQDQNLLATYREILGNREQYFDEVYNDSRLGEIRIEKLNEISEDNTYNSIDNQEESDEGASTPTEGSNTQSEDKDNYIKNLNEKLGDYSNWQAHLDMDIKSYLGSLEKTDTENNLGIADTMSYEQAAAMLYSSVDYTNRKTMIQSIKDIANRNAGFEAFNQLAKDLESRPDLTLKFYNTFGKFIVSKIETVVDGESAVSRTSNRSADKITCLKFEYLNSVKATATLIEAEDSQSLYDELVEDSKEIKKYQKLIDDIKGDDSFDVADRMALLEEQDAIIAKVLTKLTQQLKNYYPTLDDTTIAHYVYDANNKNVGENIQTLVRILQKTIESGKNTMANFTTRQASIGKTYRRLKELEALLSDDVEYLMDRKLMPENQGLKNKKEIREAIKQTNEDLEDLFGTDYVDESSKNAAFELANELSNYAPVKTQLNSRNVHGNQSSDVINNSMITNIMNTLKSTIALKNFGEYKSQSRQYDFSNIMIEHKDENGVIINYGLFRLNEQSQEFEPTEYAQQLLRAKLFNGASDMANSDNVLYSEMSKGDYSATAFINFFNVEDVISKNDYGIQFANYFMRIPSDAPKNFIMVAPKYSIKETREGKNDGLFQIKDLSAVKIEVQRRINNLPIVGTETYNEKYGTFNELKLNRSLKQIVSDATAKKIGDIRLPGKSFINEKQAKEGDEVTVTCNYQQIDKSNNTSVDNNYVLQGTLKKDNEGNYYLSSPKFLGFEDAAHSTDVSNSLKKHFMNEMIRNGEVERKINTEHPVFKQFKQIFLQELNDAANALDVFFDNQNGLIALDENGKPIFKEGFANDKKTARRLFKGYHLNGKTLYDIVNGKAVLSGKVFQSDRFRITKVATEDGFEYRGKKYNKGDVYVEDYGNDILDEAFSLLYGGANNTYIHTIRGEKGVTVQLTNKQNNVINEKLSKFILDYIEDANERIEQYRDFIPEHLMNDDNVAEFALNHHLTYVGFNDLFEGDTKFYKDTQTFLKRAKESQGSGVPYGNVNYDVDLSTPPVDLPSGLDTANFIQIDKNGNRTNFDVKLRDKFKAITIKNTVRTGETIGVFEKDDKGNIKLDERGIPKMKKIGSLTKNLIEALRENGYTAQAANDKAKQMMAGYDSTTVNDAQSYITFEEWVRRITARGQLPKYKELIAAVLDESKPLDAASIGQFIQVQKNFYYDQHYDKNLRTFNPRQIKNAEFVLVPRLIRGTELEEVYNLMKEKGIDQLNTEETSKAGKNNVLTLWDEEGNLTQENIDDFRESANEDTIENFSYNYLYTQQETPQHVDAENKAGIQLMKKIVDNIPPGHKLFDVKTKFFNLYCANIENSRNDLLDELGVELDKNGNIQINDNGKIVGLNPQVFFNMLRDEAMRLGLDSNAMDYLTLSEDVNAEASNLIGITNMPTYMSNFATKLESIAQSLFNNRITRQKLPGFHAAQITNIGFKPMSATVQNVQYSKRLQYHPTVDGKVQPYAEIYLPKNAFNFKREKEDGTLKTDEELLKELQEAGLDEIIGYRIPTEGKQSICIMKVVGFTDDAYGSTIVVPDDWVAQTGSDFDIDSVYGINFNTYIDRKTGKIKKIEYKKEPTREGYYSYIRRRLEHKLPTADVKAVKAAIPDELQAEYQELFKKEGELYKALPEEVRNIIKELQKVEQTDNKRDNYARQNESVINGLKDYLSNNTISAELTKQIEEYITNRENLNDYVVNFDEKFTERFDEKAEELKFKEVEKKAEKTGLPTYEQFTNMLEEERNDRQARNNEILHCMLEILRDSSSLEENLSRSNFDDLIDARDGKKDSKGKRIYETAAVDKNTKARRDARSPYNFFDQAEYQDDVMSGAKLKAFSVTRDTFVSICNTVQPYLSKTNQISVIYREADGFTEKQLKAAFDNVEKIQDGVWKVTHDRIGWSKNNKNVVGRILTTYTSETTAHILDAVKEGAIPNVNDLTFGIYKTFTDIGSDFQTSVAFMNQPGIRRIVEAYNRNKSVYSRDNKNPIHTAIKELAKDIFALDGKSLDTRRTIGVILQQLEPYSKEIGRLFDAKWKEGDKDNFIIGLSDEQTSKLAFSASRMRDRIKGEGIFAGSSPVKERMKLLFDLGVILQYNKLSNLSNNITSYARVCNPDKFGAKQSIFATEDVFRSISTILERERDNTVLYTKDGNKTRKFLEAIYPGIDKITSIDDFIKSDRNDSLYPPLNAFLKYATATSIKINRGLFETQNQSFVNRLLDLKYVFSGNNNRITEKQYKEYQNYVLNYIYTATPAVQNAVTYKIREGIVTPGINNIEEERRRIFGYGKTPDLRVPVLTDAIEDNNGKMIYEETGDTVEFTVKDFNNPTQTEINQFATFSPAQKVLWLQRHMYDAGIFNYIRTNLFNNQKYRKTKAGAQIIEYIEGNESIETIYQLFEEAFYNSNPLVKLAALDIVKYAFAVEGFRMKRNAVNKSIKNNALMDSTTDGGTGIISAINGRIGTLTDNDMENIRHQFVRSHSSMSQISTYRVDKQGKYDYELKTTSDGFIQLNILDNRQAELADKYGFTYDTTNVMGFDVNKYVKLRYGKTTTLYKILQNPNNAYELVAYPINLLEENEHGDWSVNIKNNTHLSENYYEKVLSDYFNSPIEDKVLKQFVDENAELRKESRFINRNRLASSSYATDFNINEKGVNETAGFEKVIEKVTEHFSELTKEPLYVRSIVLTNYIKHIGQVNGSIQKINGKDYIIEKVDFKKYNDIYIGKKNIDHEIKESNPQIVKLIEQARTHGQYGAAINNAFKITPASYLETEVRHSSISESEIEYPNVIRHSSVTEADMVTEANVQSINYMKRRAISAQDMKANEFIQDLNRKGIIASSPSVTSNQAEVTAVTAAYVTHSIEKIIDKVDYFFQDSNMEYHSILDPETIELIRNNPEKRQEFIKTLLDARAFVKNYELYTKIDISSADPELRNNLTKIQNAIKELENNLNISQAEKMFATEYLAKLSDNPLIQDDILSLLDGYHSASAFDAWINDLQETSSPLIQIITKEVMGDIRAEEMKAQKIVKAFRNTYADIIQRAKAAGRPINWSHIVDEYGRFVQAYNNNFVDKIEELRDKVSEAIYTYGNNSVEHLKAKLEYDKFKLKHTQQKLIDDYYRSKIEYEERILNSHPLAYSKYKQLEDRKRQVLSFMREDGLEASKQQEFNEIKREMDDLIKDYFFDAATGTFENKLSFGDPNNRLTGDNKKIYSLEAAGALSEFLSDMEELRKDYFKQDAKFGFDETLRKNLDIIRIYELPVNGVPTTPIEILNQHDDYIKAKTWIEHNARFVVDESIREELNQAFRNLGEGKKGRSVLSAIAKRDNLYDSHGVIDGTKISEEDIKKIKDEQMRNYNLRENQPVSDKVLISNAPESNTIFKAEFYNGLRRTGFDSQEYINLVNEINSILRKYYDPSTKILYTYKIELNDLEKLIELYEKIEGVKRKVGGNGTQVYEYIQQNVDFVTNDEEYQRQRDLAQNTQHGQYYFDLWKQLNERTVEINGADVTVPNRMIYGYAVPRGYTPDGRGNNTMVDTTRTSAVRTIRKYTMTTNTEYYYQKFREMSAKPRDEFDAWYKANHIYNPTTHNVEPIACWTRLTIKPVADDGTYLPDGMYVPAFNQLESSPQDDKLNSLYRGAGSSVASNYKDDGNGTYANNIHITQEEQEMKDLLQGIIQANATTTSAKRFIERGFLPSRSKGAEVDTKFIAKEAAKLVGWVQGASGRDAWYSDVDYANDTTPQMPFMDLVKSKDSVKVDRKIPERNANETEDEFKERFKKWREDKKVAEATNLEIHKNMLDNNWEDVISDFILKSAHFNAVQNNKYMLFYGKNMIDKLDVLVKNIGFNELERDSIRSTEDENRYLTKKDTNLRDQYTNWIRRLVYDQWKKRNNNFTRAGNILQSLSSAKFMMMNVTGGIANITVGETNILGEILAKDYLGKKEYLRGKAIWSSGIPSYFADMYKEEASSLPSAIIKAFNVVDFDELNGVVTVPDMQEYLKRARDIMFSPQAMGEHFMQNSILFSLLESHRLVVDDNAPNNCRLSYKYMNEAEYTRKIEHEILSQILDDNQELKNLYNKFRERELKDANDVKEYAWFRKDITSQFISIYMQRQHPELVKQYNQKVKEAKKTKLEEFEKLPSLYSQLELKDGMMSFKEDSILGSQMTEDEAYKLIGRFKGRVISVNKKIHGVYDKLGAAQIENHWLGGVVMQYHKHIYPGVMKRYRRQGYFNEERGSIEKGCYASLKDFLAIPFRQAAYAKKLQEEIGISQAELQAVEGIQNIFKNCIEFISHIKTNWKTIPEYEKSNIKRALMDVYGVLGALCLAVALRCMVDDDDDGIAFNLFMYEADRLASESAMFTPWGLYSEGKKLWSSPVAVQGTISDILNTMGLLSQYIIQGDEFDPYYSSGLYAGDNRFEVMLRRNIPVWHAWDMLSRLSRSNKYYKLGDNMLSIIPVKDVADFITDRK